MRALLIVSLLGSNAAQAGEPLEPLLAIQRGVTGGGYTEFQLAPPNDKPDWSKFQHWKKDSLFLHMEGMTLLWKPFHDVDPGFDVYLPRLFDPKMLGRLADALDAHQKEWLALDSLAAARARWGKFSAPINGLETEKDWRRAQKLLSKTMDDLKAWAKKQSQANQWAWVLGA